MKDNKDNKNEGIGIFTIIVIVVLAILVLYYFFGYRTSYTPTNATVPLEAPAPTKGNNPSNPSQ